MKKKTKKQIVVLMGIMLLLVLWICLGLLTPPSPRDQVLSVIDTCIRQSWGHEHAAKELVQGPIDPYPYWKEILQSRKSALEDSYWTLFKKAPKKVAQMLERPISTQERTDFTAYVFVKGCSFDKNIDRILALAQDQDTNIIHLVDAGLRRRWPMSEDKWTFERLLQVLDSPAEGVRSYAFSAFQMAGKNGQTYDSRLDKFLYHTNESIALNAAVTIHCIGGDTNRTIPVLEKLMDSQSEAVKFWSACQMLFVSRNHPKPADIFAELACTKSHFQWLAFNYLPYCGKRAIPHLTKVRDYVAVNKGSLDDVARVAIIRVERQSESDVSGPLDFIRHIPLPFAMPIPP